MKSYNRDRMIHINYIKDDLISSIKDMSKDFYEMEYDKMTIKCDELLEKIIELKKSISNEE
jgi:chromatin remodeling complex protein RSC6